MCPLHIPARRAFVQTCDIFQRFAGKEPLPLLSMRGLLLRYSAEDGFPKISDEGGQTAETDSDARDDSEGKYFGDMLDI